MADPLSLNGFSPSSILKMTVGQDAMPPRGAALLPEPPTPFPFPVARNNFDAANAELKLTPQEVNAYHYHLNNAVGPGGVDWREEVPRDEVTSRSTYLMTPYEKDGRHYFVPGVENGKILSREEAHDLAEKLGLDKYPSYASRKEMLDRMDKIHKYMAKDMDEIAAAQGQ